MSENWRLAAPDFGDLEEREAQFDRGLVIAVVSYDEESGEAEVALHPTFPQLNKDTVFALDVLSDAIGLLTKEYERRLREPGRDGNPSSLALAALGHGSET
jgi:hypothetical protein